MDKLRACAIVIGLEVNEDGTKSAEPTAENDARSMAEFLKGRGFRLLSVDANGEIAEKPMTGESATKEAVTATVKYAAKKIDQGGTLVVFFSGHGFSAPQEDLPDGRAEGWVLHDGNMWDREWKLLLAEFAAGVHVVVVTDICFSGGMGPPDADDPDPLPVLPDCHGARHVSEKKAAQIWERERTRYADLQRNPKLDATVLLFAACQANQNACVGKKNGLFTSRLIDIAQDPMLSYRDMYLKVRARFHRRGTQSPFYWPAGPDQHEFSREPAFSVEGASDLDGGPGPDPQ